MPALAPIQPKEFKMLLERYGFQVQEETEYNWVLFKAEALRPVIPIPKKGALVSVDIMMGILDQLKITNEEYFTLLDKVRTLNPAKK